MSCRCPCFGRCFCLPNAGWASTYDYTITNGTYSIVNFQIDPAFTGSITAQTSPTDSITAADIQVDNFHGQTLTFTDIITPPSGQYPTDTYWLALEDTTDTYYLNIFIDDSSKGVPVFTGGPATIDPLSNMVLASNPFVTVAYDFAGSLTDPSPTPLPAALPLFAGGLGILGLMGARRRRKAAAA